MAHRQGRTLHGLLAIALFALAVDARALSLGEPVVGSAPGQPFDVRFPVSLERGESIQPSCFQLASGTGLASGTVSLERSAGATMLRLRSVAPVAGDAVSLSIVAKCAGQDREYRREYTVALGARTAGAPTSLAAAAAPSSAIPPPSQLLPSIATLVARIGDTLESIARAIFPNNRAVRASYVEALRANNPSLTSLRDDEPIPVDTPVSLPDLRAFSQAQRAHAFARRESTPPRAVAPAPAEPSASAESPAPAKPAARAKPAPRTRPAHETPAPRRESAPRPRADAVPPTMRESIAPAREAAPPAGSRGNFVLKLSSPEIDLSRSRGIDERSRAQLRERLTILDADDQVAALLALQHSVKQLETQVAQLQLKLSGMPASFPPATSAKSPEPAVVPPPALPPPAAETTRPEPAKAPPEPVETKPAPPPAPVESKATAPVEATPAPPVESKPEVTPPEAKEASRPLPARAGPPTPWMDYGLWALAILFALIAVLLAVRLARRSRASREDAEEEELEELPDAAPVGQDDSIVIAEEPLRGPEPASVAVASPARRELDSDVVLPTRIPTNTEDLRQRYIEERFPEIGKGVIALDDPDSVVKGARLFYEDGALARAVELLQYAIERSPTEIKAWLALFEIFRLERLTGEFAQLAVRFKEQHGKSDYWSKVQYFGREIDPGNALYATPAIDNFQTIGPAQAKRIAAADNVDPVAENWLGAPMDFQNEVLANELRKTLMVDAGINEQDLVPNPMPALRNVEMFSVA